MNPGDGVLSLINQLANLTEEALRERLAEADPEAETSEQDRVSERLRKLDAILDQRQKLLTQIQNADTSSLDPETRRELFDRVRAVQKADRRLTALLRERTEGMRNQLDRTLRARGAIRAYRPGEGERPRTRGRNV